MTKYRKIMLAGACAIAAIGVGAASAQTPDTRITVIGAVNDPAHVRAVTDNRDAAIPELPVVYESQTSAQAQAAPAPASNANQAAPASTERANLAQTVKSQ